MFSHIGSIFTHKPRHAETLDTRQAIRRHDPDHESTRKKKKGGQEKFIIDEDDHTVVSVEALRAFLEHFLNTQMIENQTKARAADMQEHAMTHAPEPRKTAENTGGMASVAANAYQHTAQASQKSQTVLSDDASQSYLGGADIRVIHQLLDDLKALSAKDVEYLNIERSESFLGSLSAAVEKLK